MNLQNETGGDLSEYHNTMNLVREQIAAMSEYRVLLERCQAENKKLLEILAYYGWTDWRELSMTDRGEVARQTCREVAGGGIQNNSMRV